MDTLTDPRYWARVDRSAGPDACWPWTGSTDRKGYGHVNRPKLKPSPMLAHRYAWQLAHGDPGALCVLHRCDRPPCCNPAHLFLGTVADNNADMRAKGRSSPPPDRWKGRRRCAAGHDLTIPGGMAPNGPAWTCRLCRNERRRRARRQ